MTAHYSSDGPTLPRQDTRPFLKRSPEIDKFVDRFLATMCDRSRRQILELLTIPYGEESEPLLELRSGDIAKALKLSPATISEHLHQLATAGLVNSRREGHGVYYRLSNHMLIKAFCDLLAALDEEHAIRQSQTAGAHQTSHKRDEQP